MDAKFPKTKAKFDRVAFRSVAWELMVGYAGKLPDLEVSIDGGAPEPSLSVMVGRTDPYTYYKERGLRMTPQASLETGLDVLSVRKLARRNVPRIAAQVFGSARHVQSRDIDYSARRLARAGDARTGRSRCRSTATRSATIERLEIELAREALWVVA